MLLKTAGVWDNLCSLLACETVLQMGWDISLLWHSSLSVLINQADRLSWNISSYACPSLSTGIIWQKTLCNCPTLPVKHLLTSCVLHIQQCCVHFFPFLLLNQFKVSFASFVLGLKESLIATRVDESRCPPTLLCHSKDRPLIKKDSWSWTAAPCRDSSEIYGLWKPHTKTSLLSISFLANEISPIRLADNVKQTCKEQINRKSCHWPQWTSTNLLLTAFFLWFNK